METLLGIIGLVPLLMGFAEHLGESRLRHLERAIRENLTIQRFVLFPVVVFKKSSLALTWNEAIMTGVVIAFFVFFMRHPIFSDVQEYYVTAMLLAVSPVRWLQDNLGIVGGIVGAPIAVFVTFVLAFLLPMLFLLLVVTIAVLIVLYPMLGLLSLANWSKKSFGLSGSVIKISSWALAIALYLTALFLKFSAGF